MYDELKPRLDRMELRSDRTDRLLLGDPENPNDSPGLIFEQRRLSENQERMSEKIEELRADVKDVRGDLKKIAFLIVSLFIGAIGTVVFKGPHT